MKARTRLGLIWANVVGAAAVATGLAHDAVIGTQVDGLKPLSQDYYDGSLWLFLCTGTAVAFAGVLLILAARGLVRGELLARRVTLASGLFLVVLGVLGLVFKQYAATSLLAFGVLSFVPWWLTRGARASQPLLDSSVPAQRSAPSPHPTVGR